MSKANAFTVRFAVGAENGLRSGIWRVWSNQAESDVYLAIRTIAGRNKISLHATGCCNASMTSQEAQANPSALLRQGGTRHLDKWNRRVLTGDLLSIPLRLRFPASELRQGIDPASKGAKVCWLVPPQDGHALDVLCVFTSSIFENEWPWKANGGNLINWTHLPNGETFWLISRVYPTESGLTDTLNSRKPIGMPLRSRVLIGETGPANVRILTDAASDHSRAATLHLPYRRP